MTKALMGEWYQNHYFIKGARKWALAEVRSSQVLSKHGIEPSDSFLNIPNYLTDQAKYHLLSASNE